MNEVKWTAQFFIQPPRRRKTDATRSHRRRSVSGAESPAPKLLRDERKAARFLWCLKVNGDRPWKCFPIPPRARRNPRGADELQGVWRNKGGVGTAANVFV